MSISTIARRETPSNNPLALAETVDRAREYAEAAHAPNTRRAYESGWSDFTTYCHHHSHQTLPASPQTVVLYITQLAERAKLSTVRLRLAAISHVHTEHGLPSPTAHEIVCRVIKGMTRTLGTSQTKKDAVTLDVLRAMLLEINRDDLKALRDRAIVLLGFAAALRRSELAQLDVEDLKFAKSGLLIHLRRSKTDQSGIGTELAVPLVPNETLCAVRAVRAWIDAAQLSAGALFRSFTINRRIQPKRIGDRDVANLIKSLTAKAHVAGDFSGHSLRAGFATTAADANVSLDAIARTTRHKSLSVLVGYIRHARAFEGVALTSMIA